MICTFPARAMCAQGQISIQRRDASFQMCQCPKFGVAESKIQKLRGFHDKKIHLWHVLLVPLITGYPNGFRPSMMAIGPQSSSRIRPLVGLQH